MRKFICYTCGLGLLLAGATAFGAGQNSPLPPPPPPIAGGVPSADHVLPDAGPIPTPDTELASPGGRVSSPSTGTMLAASPEALAPISMAVPPANSGGPPPSPGQCVMAPRDCPCCHHDACCYGIRPLGGCVCAQIRTQVDNGIASQMVLYNYDFNDPAIGDPAKLSPYGLRRLTLIERYLQSGCNYPVIVEGTMGNAALDSARQMHISSALGEAGMTPQVVVGETPATFSGAESLLLYANRLQEMHNGGATFAKQNSSSGNSGTTSSGGNSQGVTQ